MRILFVLLILFAWSCNSHDSITAGNSYTPKDFVLTGKVNKMLSEKVYLYNFYGHKTNKIDSALVDGNGSFVFKVSKEKPIGLYRIILGKTIRSQFMGGGDQYVDLIFNYEDISFETHFDFPYDSMNIIQNNENKLYYEYILKSDENKNKMDVLMYCLQYYPRTDNFYKVLSKQYSTIYNEYDKYLNQLIKNNKGSFLAKIAAFEKLPFVDPLNNKDKRNELLKINFFNKDDFTDTLLLHSDLIPTKVIKFLSFYRNENLTQEMQEAEFIKAVDEILKNAGSNEHIYNSVLDYLIEGFERFDMEMTLLHIYDNYVLGNSCMDNEKAESLKEKTEAIKRLGKGQPAPEFSFKDENGKLITLKEINADFTLIVFWASWCDHCTKIIPQIHDLYTSKDPSTLQVIAISLDKELKPWKDYIKEHELKWLNYSSLKGWDCPISRSYFIYATPTMFLLDKDKKILAKPLNVRDVKMSLQ